MIEGTSPNPPIQCPYCKQLVPVNSSGQMVVHNAVVGAIEGRYAPRRRAKRSNSVTKCYGSDKRGDR